MKVQELESRHPTRTFLTSIVICSLIFLAGCTSSVSTSGEFTEDFENYTELCDSGDDSCYQAVARYNEDPQLCDNIQTEDVQADCKRTLQDGTLVDRELTQGYGCSFDNREFAQTCKDRCAEQGLTYEGELRQTMDDPIPLSSLGGYMSCVNLSTTAIMTCHCY